MFSGNSLFLGKTKSAESGRVNVEVIRMDPEKIGKFIAQLRKECSFTQEQLGEKIGVSNKTISRWETGTYLPPADSLLAMSELFHVSINEILTGKHLQTEEYQKAAEENLAQVIRESSFSLNEKVDFYKKKWLKDHTALLIFLGLCIAGVYLTGFLLKQPLISILAVLLCILAHGWRNNAMMTYVEQRAYDGTGAQ